MRDLGVGEIGIFRRRPNAQCQSWAVGRLRARPPTWRLRGGLGGGLHGGEGVAEGGRATWYPTLCIGLGQQGRSCYTIAVATKRPS